MLKGTLSQLYLRPQEAKLFSKGANVRCCALQVLSGEAVTLLKPGNAVNTEVVADEISQVG